MRDDEKMWCMDRITEYFVVLLNDLYYMNSRKFDEKFEQRIDFVSSFK